MRSSSAADRYLSSNRDWSVSKRGTDCLSDLEPCVFNNFFLHFETTIRCRLSNSRKLLLHPLQSQPAQPMACKQPTPQQLPMPLYWQRVGALVPFPIVSSSSFS